MTRHGLLTKDRFAPVVPMHAPAYHIAPAIDFGGVDMLTLTYLTDADTAAQIVPDVLELDDHPVVTLSFLNYTISGAGSYREVVQSIACRHREQAVGYVPHIYVTNEPAMIAGREWLGWPKMLADITFSTHTTTLDGLIIARLERPAGLELATAQFVPTQRLDSQILTAAGDNVTMNLRVIPSPVPGQEPTVTELVPSTMTALSGEVWAGHGSVHLTGISEFTPLHRFPVVEVLGAMLIRNADMRLTAPTETFPL
ncbi:MAG: acetoacetate decarboxylase family protein [Actinomycetota bacterium]